MNKLSNLNKYLYAIHQLSIKHGYSPLRVRCGPEFYACSGKIEPEIFL